MSRHLSQFIIGVFVAISTLSPVLAAMDAFGDPLPEEARQRLGTTRMRYSTVLGDILYLTDDLAAVAVDTQLEIWDLTTCSLKASYNFAGSSIAALDLAPEGDTLLIAQRDGLITEWSVASASTIQTWQTAQAQLCDVCYSPDAQRVLSCGYMPPTLKEFSRDDHAELVSITGTKQVFTGAVYVGERRVVVGGGYKFIVSLYDLETGEELNEWLGDYCANDLQVSDDGERLLVGFRYRASEWLLSDFSRLAMYSGHLGGAVNSVCYCGDGKQVLTCSRDGSIRCWDRVAAEVLSRWYPHEGAVEAMRVSPNGRFVLSWGGRKGAYGVVETTIATGKPRVEFPRHTASVNAVAPIPGSNQVISASDDATLRVWDAVTGQCSLKIAGPTAAKFTAIAVAPDGTRVSAGCSDGTVREYSLPSGQYLRTLAQHTGFIRDAVRIPGTHQSYDPSLLTCADDGTVRVWDDEHAQWALAMLSGHSGGVLSVAVSSDGTLALTGGRDGTVRLYDLTTMQSGMTTLATRIFAGHRGWVEGVCFAGSSTYCFSGGRDGRIIKWDVATGAKLAEMQHSGWIHDIVCSPDGRIVCAAGEDRRITCWDAATGDLLTTYTGHTDIITALAISADGTMLISASEDATLLTWPLPSPAGAK